jgi:hypothetical protein
MLSNSIFIIALAFAVAFVATKAAPTCINQPTMFTPTGPFTVELDSDKLLPNEPSSKKYNCFDRPLPNPATDAVEESIADTRVNQAELMANTFVSQVLMSSLTDDSYFCPEGVKYIVIDDARFCELRDGQVQKAGKFTVRANCDTVGNCKGCVYCHLCDRVDDHADIVFSRYTRTIHVLLLHSHHVLHATKLAGITKCRWS